VVCFPFPVSPRSTRTGCLPKPIFPRKVLKPQDVNAGLHPFRRWSDLSCWHPPRSVALQNLTELTTSGRFRSESYWFFLSSRNCQLVSGPPSPFPPDEGFGWFLRSRSSRDFAKALCPSDTLFGCSLKKSCDRISYDRGASNSRP